MASELLPENFEIPNPYNIPVHNQGNKNSCTAHAFSLMLEYHLSDYFKERTLIDVDDLWEKQKKFGTASEERGDLPDGPFRIAAQYGARFRTDSGKTGTVFLSGNKRIQNGIVAYEGWYIKLDHALEKIFPRISNFLKNTRLVKLWEERRNDAMDSVEELKKQIYGLLQQLEALSGSNSVSTERIEKYLSEFTQRINVLLTIAALLSGFAVAQPVYLKSFLTTSFPLFIIAVFFYLLSSRRLNLLSSDWTVVSEKILKDSYLSTRKWYILTDFFLVAFFVAFIINLYFFAFGLEMTQRDILFSYIIALLLGGLRYFYIKAVVPKVSNGTEMSAVGAPSANEEMYFAGVPSTPPPDPLDRLEK